MNEKKKTNRKTGKPTETEAEAKRGKETESRLRKKK